MSGIFREMLEAGQPIVILEKIHQHKNGRRIVIETSGVPFYNQKGKLIGYRGINRDITQKKQAEKALRESEKKFAAAFQTAPTLLAITKIGDGRIKDVNDAFVRTFGYSRDELLGQSTLELGLWASPLDRTKMIEESAENHGSQLSEVTVRTKTGKELQMLMAGRKINIKGEQCLISMAIDITERKQVEEEWRKLATVVKYSRELVNTATLEGQMQFLNEAGGKMGKRATSGPAKGH